MRGYISCVTHCPYEGAVEPGAVARLAAALYKMGCTQIALGETIGAGTPEAIDAMLRVVQNVVPASMLSGHYHDTGGRALANIDVSLERGLRCFDGAAGGLGGCPYAPGAKGNVASEAVVDFLHDKGYETGIDRDRLREAAQFARTLRSEGLRAEEDGR